MHEGTKDAPVTTQNTYVWSQEHPEYIRLMTMVRYVQTIVNYPVRLFFSVLACADERKYWQERPRISA